jgi:dihydroxyacid dehydratase/phosphogluconate dehydratase
MPAMIATPISTGVDASRGARRRVYWPSAYRKSRIRPQTSPRATHLTEVAASVKNGVYEAGGIPLELPVVSLGETLLRPTAMLWRNMAAMATEEMLRANPIDGVVLLGGCDKTIPALLMAAASVGLPAVVVPGGPMLTGTFRGVLWAAAPTSGGCRKRSGPARSPRSSPPARSRP